jgi:hypothetical protein
MQGHVAYAEVGLIHLIELIDTMHAEDVDEARRQAAIRYNPDGLLYSTLVQLELFADDLFISTEITKVNADIEADLRKYRIDLRRCTSDHAVAAAEYGLQDAHVSYVYLKRAKLCAFFLVMEILQRSRPSVANLDLFDRGPVPQLVRDRRPYRTGSNDRDSHAVQENLRIPADDTYNQAPGSPSPVLRSRKVADDYEKIR